MRYQLLIFTILIFFASCEKKLHYAPDQSEIVGLATPIQLGIDSTKVYLTDYFPNWKVIDRITLPSGITMRQDEGDSVVSLYHNNSSLRFYEVMSVFTSKGQYDIPLKNSLKKQVTFRYKPRNSNPSKVQIAGQVNNWNPSESLFTMTDDGIWEYSLWLNPGKYQYKLVVDGAWILDPDNPIIEDNNIGGQNSIVTVEGPNLEKVPYQTPIDFRDKELVIQFTNQPTHAYVFWENYRLDERYLSFNGDKLTIQIPQNAKKQKRSHLRIWIENQFGPGNDLLIPLEYQSPVTYVSQLTRNDKHTQILYFLMIDRFFNGNPDNDQPVNDPAIHPKANYMGGDLQGIEAKIRDGYFDSLGINTIWLSPVTQNPLDAWGLWPNPRTKFSGYHGYWPIRSTRIDFRFGTDEDLTRLLNTAHTTNKNLLLDYVANHVHKDHPIYQKNPNWATPLYLPDGSLNTERWDEYRLTTWFDTFLPTLDLERREVFEPMTDSALFWVTAFDFDGFRHDATKHIPEVFWRRLTQKIKIAKPQSSIYQIGETYGSRELIGSYVGSGMMDAQFDFNLYDAAVATFARKNTPFSTLNDALLESMSYYGWLHLMGNMSGNQDKPRFISLASGDVRFDEDAKLAGWTRNIVVSDTNAYHRLQLIHAFNLTVPGIPTIYYGDEIGLPGANDPDNRRMMKFEHLTEHEQNTFQTVKTWVHLRRQLLPLQYGTFRPIYVDNDTYVFMRQYLKQTVVVIFNKSDQSQTLTVKKPESLQGKISKTYFVKVEQNNDELKYSLPPLSAGLIVFE
ncbi:MAG TPA: alpha-amylase family glycosyl hydrolase [Salinivirgaceae bacterium]|nr:alpha-amylase family glycosyl hydrolase [Salinivirgaceae bacterium]